VAYYSNAPNIVPDDTNGVEDVFVYDLATGQVQRVSVADDGAEGNAMSGNPYINYDGSFAAFSSGASNLVPGDLNGMFDTFSRSGLNWPEPSLECPSSFLGGVLELLLR
jgi:Tol biopolymer transport system component